MFHLGRIKINVKFLIFELQKSTNKALVLKIVEIVIFFIAKVLQQDMEMSGLMNNITSYKF